MSCIIESVDSISRDEPDSPLTQYITNAGISRARYTITHFTPSCSTADFQSNKCITSLKNRDLAFFFFIILLLLSSVDLAR